MSKELRESTMVFFDVNAGNTHNRTIQLNFIPDRVIVRQVSYQQSTASAASIIVTTDMVDSIGSNWFAIAKHSIISTPNAEFQLCRSKVYSGQATFQIYRQNGANMELIDVSGGAYAGGELCILLEFIKYV